MTNISNWYGKIKLIYAQRTKTTELIYNYAQSPLKIQRAFYPEDHKICHSVILHTAGGIVGGDRLDFDINLQADSQALITTASAGKIYRSHDKIAVQNVNMQVDKGAYLEWLPQENIIFNGAIYTQNMRIELSENSHYLGWEINRFGRTARGEKFMQGSWRSHTEIWQNDQPLWIDRQGLQGGEDIINSPNGLAGKAIIANLVFVGANIDKDLVQKARNLWLGDPTEIGVTRLTSGLLCRYRGNSSHTVRMWFMAVWHLLRYNYFNLSPIVPRIWPTMVK
jgi:urease accessory protein